MVKWKFQKSIDIVELERKITKRFYLTRYLNFTEEEIIENERIWAEEND